GLAAAGVVVDGDRDALLRAQDLLGGRHVGVAPDGEPVRRLYGEVVPRHLLAVAALVILDARQHGVLPRAEEGVRDPAGHVGLLVLAAALVHLLVTRAAEVARHLAVLPAERAAVVEADDLRADRIRAERAVRLRGAGRVRDERLEGRVRRVRDLARRAVRGVVLRVEVHAAGAVAREDERDRDRRLADGNRSPRRNGIVSVWLSLGWKSEPASGAPAGTSSVKRPFRSVRVWSVPSCTSQPPPGRGGFDTAS